MVTGRVRCWSVVKERLPQRLRGRDAMGGGMEWQMQIVEDILWAGSIDNGVPDDITSPAPKHLYHCSAPRELIHTVCM